MKLSKLTPFLDSVGIDFGDPGNRLNEIHPKTFLENLSKWLGQIDGRSEREAFLEALRSLLEYWSGHGMIEKNPMEHEDADRYLGRHFK